jgi:hypothetical protein
LRHRQLADLLDAVDALCEYLPQAPDYLDAAHIIREYRVRIASLLESGFDQDSLSALSRSIRPIIYTHKEWIPPLVERADGSWQEPDWFPELNRLHEVMLQKALDLRIIGER